MTVLEALYAVKKELNGIPVKIEDIDTVGLPIRNSVANIKAVIDALERNAQENQAEQNPTQEAKNGKAADDQQQDV